MRDFHAFSNAQALSQATAELFIKTARKAVEERGLFTVALSGGSTPKHLFEELAQPACSRDIPWDRTLIFWSDERAVPPDSEHSNYRLANDTLLSRITIPEKNILRIKGELGAQRAAEELERDLTETFGDQGMPRFDFVLLGLGTDGHTASLFPGTEALSATTMTAAVINPPANPQMDRVTFSLPILNNARTVLFMVIGDSKRRIVSEIRSDPTAVERYPAARVSARKTLWFADHAALGKGE
ncbi:6-phosphogluconolactonase [uncultured Pseudodesulfovibrio sp.]|uniref:6-phosphogluconolactonase n=1 Tax=uncultured Pseudodesulfovibrio sp. TaxID=2035858 RepID=UPI0029C61B2E|nr:6-phosphogluconolactonase [uncultured Pseudodesulfovibrio sp.]